MSQHYLPHSAHSHSKPPSNGRLSDGSDDAYSLGSVDGEGADVDGNNDNNNNKSNGNAVQEMIAKETASVRQIQNRVLLFLATAAILVCIAIGVVSARMETDAIDESFAGSADFLIEQLEVQAAHVLEAAASLSVSLTLANQTKALWTQEGERAQQANKILAEGEGVFIKEDLALAQEAPQDLFVTDPFFETRASIVQDMIWMNPEQLGSGPALLTNPILQDGDRIRYPIWQVAPTSEQLNQILRMDLQSIPTAARAIDRAVAQKAAVLSGVLSPREQSRLGLLGRSELAAMEEAGTDVEPLSLLVVPVFETVFADYEVDHDQAHRVVGTVLATFSWSQFMAKMISDEEYGFHVVLKDTCWYSNSEDELPSTQFTYKIQNQATFLGLGDHHQSYYDYTEKFTTMDEVLSHVNVAAYDGLFSYAPVVADDTYYASACSTDFRLYQSSHYRQSHKTKNAAIVTGSVVIILVLVILAVLMYASRIDFSLNTTVEKYARTQHLINSLFPKDVQEKMFQDNDLAPKVLKGDAPLLQVQSAIKEKEANNTKALPIAERFESATVMFADIAGFTNWCSGREPENVFLLLETIYNAFDKSAKERGVFKVETIGDCYMCVCGLPERRDDHASAMCIFAQTCLRQMRKLTRELQEKLGGDTDKLALRTGLHSGGVTAGVLRGEKSRFQLFGDTVNTASRMESTGLKNRIQISNSTADLLRREGKEHWFVEREGGVEAKGKGRMDTFWLSSASMSATTGTRSSNSGDGRARRLDSSCGQDESRDTDSYSGDDSKKSFSPMGDEMSSPFGNKN